MSTHNFKVHDTNKANIWSDADYNNLPERTAGYVATDGIKSKDFNTFMREASLQAVALSDLLINSDDGSAATLGIESDAQDVKAAYLRGFNKNVEAHLENSQTISGINQDISGIEGDITSIESRLDALGFKSGSFTIDTSSATVITNTITKQGKYAIGNLEIAYTSDPGNISVPNDFKPKETTNVVIGYRTPSITTGYLYKTITINTNGELDTSSLSGTTKLIIINAGWELA